MPKLHTVDRQEIFLRLVELQDSGLDVRQTRSEISHRYGITTEDVCDIEFEGLKKQWPPLSIDPKKLLGEG